MKLNFKGLDTIQILGFLISAAVSLAMLRMQQEPVASVTLGFVLAALTQLFDLQKRQSDSEQRLLDATKLSTDLCADEWLFKQIQQVVKDYGAVKDTWYVPFRLRSNEAIRECRSIIHGLAEGQLTIQSDGPYASGAYSLSSATTTLKAVAAIDPEYWRGPEAKAYLKENHDAVRRGVQFVRIFTYPTAVLRQMIDIMQFHKQLGIDVYVASPDSVPREYNQDYLIIDDRVIYRTEQVGQQQRISIDDLEVEQTIQDFAMLLRYAKPLEEALASSCCETKGKSWTYNR